MLEKEIVKNQHQKSKQLKTVKNKLKKLKQDHVSKRALEEQLKELEAKPVKASDYASWRCIDEPAYQRACGIREGKMELLRQLIKGEVHG